MINASIIFLIVFLSVGSLALIGEWVVQKFSKPKSKITNYPFIRHE